MEEIASSNKPVYSVSIVASARLLGGPLLAALVYFLALSSWGHAASATAAVAAWMAFWWMTEAIPLPVTALLPILLFPALGVFEGRGKVGQAVWVPRELNSAELNTAELDAAARDSLAIIRSVDRAGALVEFADRLGATQHVEWKLIRPTQSTNGIQAATAPYGDANIFTYFGGFVLALAIERWGLHRRLALGIIRLIGTSPARLSLGVMLATAFLSMWISNTAATTIMLPIGLGICRMLEGGRDEERSGSTSAMASMLLLGIAYAATIGGMATLVGTPTNGVGVNVLKENGQGITFGGWLVVAGPIAIAILGCTWLMLLVYFRPPRVVDRVTADESLRKSWQELGRMSGPEWGVFAVFLATALSWMFRVPVIEGLGFAKTYPWMRGIDDTVIAVACAISLFVIPVNLRRGEFLMNWGALRDLPWGVLLLFGGGLSLAAAMQGSGLVLELEQALGLLKGLSPWLLGAAVILAIVFLSELASNVAIATAFSPVIFALAVGVGVAPQSLILAGTLAASCGFMLPVATPPNAIVFGTGLIRQRDMIRIGFLLNLMGSLIILLGTRWLA